ncbi:MAG: DNA-processing protein DprA [Bacteroidales bacterium]
MSENLLLYRIALSDLPGVGDINARKLLEVLGDAEAVFREPAGNLIKIPGIGTKLTGYIKSGSSLSRAEKEAEFISRHNITPIWYKDEAYPARLKECADSPILIFSKGDVHPSATRVISIIGTRSATRRGKEICESIISDMAASHHDLVIVSGLAYGIDIAAHKAALRHGLPTLGIMAHGFGTIYPQVHAATAREMLEQGGLITDFLSDEPPDRNNFLKRNRIIAGMADATLVIESGTKGGAMVTADIAISYAREVFAVPGFPGEKYSAGCNLLIKSNKASLTEKADDIEYFMGWEKEQKDIPTQKTLFADMTPLEKEISILIDQHEYLTGDQIADLLGTPAHRLSSALLSLQFSGLISALPGNIYKRKGL